MEPKANKNSSDRGKVVKKQRWAMHRENIIVIKVGNGTTRTQQIQLSLIFFMSLDKHWIGSTMKRLEMKI